jgi:hypothetical protein
MFQLCKRYNQNIEVEAKWDCLSSEAIERKMVTSVIDVSVPGQRFNTIKTCRNIYGKSELTFEANGFGGKLCWGQLSSGKRPHKLVEALGWPALDKIRLWNSPLRKEAQGRPEGGSAGWDYGSGWVGPPRY